jgi:hypothetical protein
MIIAAAITIAAIITWALVAKWTWRAINAASVTTRAWRI